MASIDLDWSALRWGLPLSIAPEIVGFGLSIHGTRAVERYCLPDLWCLHLYAYEAEVEIDAQKFPIRPGYASIIPAGAKMTYRFHGRSEHIYAHFRCHTGAEAVPIPAMQEVGERFPDLYHRLERAFVTVGLARPQRAAALWDALWTLTETPRTASGNGDADGPRSATGQHPAVRRALQRIEERLADPLSVADLALYADVSYSYLARLFNEAVGTTVVGYIRQRRVQRAEHLLRNSTLPIKSIAAAVGIPDLHLFNKLIHASLGASPRAVRKRGGIDYAPSDEP